MKSLKKNIKEFYSSLDNPKVRLFVLLLFFISLFSILIIKIFSLLEKDFFNKYSKKNITIKHRLSILDRNGKVLASDIKGYDFFLEPYKIINFKENLAKIRNTFPDINISNILNQIENKKDKKNFLVLIRNNITETEKNRIIEDGVLGVYFEPVFMRYYTYKNMASHVVGFVNKEEKGVLGVERYLDDYLSKDSKNLSPIYLTIDIEIQEILRNLLKKYINKHNAKGAAGILMNIKNGEIISAISLPDFDPNYYANYKSDNLFNNFSLGVFELGSVFKLLLGGAISENNVSLEKKFSRQAYKCGDWVIHDIDHKEQKGGELSIIDGIVISSNVICAQAVDEIGYLKYYDFIKKLKFFEEADYIELLERGKPIYSKKAYQINSVTMSFGHGIAVSLIHFMKAMLILLNEGRDISPSFILNKNLYKNNFDRITDKKVTNDIVKILKKSQGYNKPDSIFQILDVGAKSGTSVKPKKQGRGYDKYNMNLQFFGVFPLYDPKFAFLLLLDEPDVRDEATNQKTQGRSVLSPAVEEFLDKIKNILDS